MASRKRSYRYRVSCKECGKEMDSDWKNSHSRSKHGGRKVEYTAALPSSQSTLNFAPQKAASMDMTEGTSVVTGDNSSLQQDGTSGEILDQPGPSTSAEPVKVTTGIDLSSNPFVNVEGCETVHEVQSMEEMTQSHVVPETTQGEICEPQRPILSNYPGRKYGNETFERSFNPNLYKKYLWISYDVASDSCHCFPCKRFLGNLFEFSNWRKPEKLIKHEQSDKHCNQALSTWIEATAMEKQKSSVLKKLQATHAEEVQVNRNYLKAIIETVCFLCSTKHTTAWK
ncbi:hypothetical protein HOLleu_44430 [Holothuria leucospilota]|uniref:Uncharacterized protein n=1 Tax=Holothuria leucospilota TaxID=206669 RepID=A0A9Q0YFW2_HOLLE|nr:hypothetical protein HOLleu_44430 [Holothuria leucospilota]